MTLLRLSLALRLDTSPSPPWLVLASPSSCLVSSSDSLRRLTLTSRTSLSTAEMCDRSRLRLLSWGASLSVSNLKKYEIFLKLNIFRINIKYF